MKQLFSLSVFVSTFIIVTLLSFWLGGFNHPFSVVEFGVLGVIVYAVISILVLVFRKIFKKEGKK